MQHGGCKQFSSLINIEFDRVYTVLHYLVFSILRKSCLRKASSSSRRYRTKTPYTNPRGLLKRVVLLSTVCRFDFILGNSGILSVTRSFFLVLSMRSLVKTTEFAFSSYTPTHSVKTFVWTWIDRCVLTPNENASE